MPVSANIFHIERASLHDGPGIRTVVYLKGCSLACRWCHNPEGICFKSEIGYHQKRCVGCGTCQEVCPKGCYYGMADGMIQINYSSCIQCNLCVESCPANALTLYGKQMTVHETMEEIKKDKDYYQSFNGGVTFSGGECLIQAEFMEEILQQCHREGITSLVESAFHVPWNTIEKVAPFVDIFYVDIKHMDTAVHREYTGKGNELILENIRKIFSFHDNIHIRIPLIPAVNDNDENLLNTGEFVQS